MHYFFNIIDCDVYCIPVLWRTTYICDKCFFIKHFHDIFQRETGRMEVEVFSEELMYYPTIKIGHALLTRQRKKEYDRLKQLEYKETIAINNRFAQQIRLSELYK